MTADARIETLLEFDKHFSERSRDRGLRGAEKYAASITADRLRVSIRSVRQVIADSPKGDEISVAEIDEFLAFVHQEATDRERVLAELQEHAPRKPDRP
jgi:hypothetical protein